MKLLKLASFPLLALLATAMIGAGPAAANQFCGMETNTGITTIRGARANIERYNPRVNTTGASSSAWSMVTNSTNLGFAQVGWAEQEDWSGNNPYYFTQYMSQNGQTAGALTWGLAPNGGNYTGAEDLFTVQYVDYVIKYRINGVTQTETIWNWTPDQGQYYCEVWSSSQLAQIGGDLNHKVDFTSPAFYSNGSWHALSPYGSNNRMFDNATYGAYTVCGPNDDPKFFQIYDNRYTTLP